MRRTMPLLPMRCHGEHVSTKQAISSISELKSQLENSTEELIRLEHAYTGRCNRHEQCGCMRLRKMLPMSKANT